MAKKNSDEEKEFVEKCKFYFGSISARGISFAYFNIDTDLVILCNSTSQPPNPLHGDRLMDYSVSELSFHFMHFKDREFLDKFCKFLQIPDGVYYCVNVILILSIFSNFKLSDLEVYENEYSDKVLINKGRKTYDKKNVVGFYIYNFHVINELFKWYKYVSEIGTEEHKLSHPHIVRSMADKIDLHGRIYFTNINTDDFKDSHGQVVFRNVQPTVKILNLDGLSTVSIKQFINKMKTPYTFYQYLWVVQHTYILSMTTFENDVVKIDSIRPNLMTIPIPSHIKISAINTTNLEE